MEKKNMPVTREEALKVLSDMNQEDADMLHYLETEAVMRALAERFGEDADRWAMLGLLHDVDWAMTKKEQAGHCIMAVEILEGMGFDAEDIGIIQSHGYGCNEIPRLAEKERKEKIEFALAAAETVTGLIYAYALMREKSITGMEVSKLRKKYKDKRFAAGCSREIISEIEKAGLSLDEFFETAINAISGIKDSIGLK